MSINFDDLSDCEKGSLLQLCFINELENIKYVDDFYKKQKRGIEILIGNKKNIKIPENELLKIKKEAFYYKAMRKK